MLRVLGRLLNRRPENIQALYENYPPGSYYVPLGEVSFDDFRSVEDTLAATGRRGCAAILDALLPLRRTGAAIGRLRFADSAG